MAGEQGFVLSPETMAAVRELVRGRGDAGSAPRGGRQPRTLAGAVVRCGAAAGTDPQPYYAAMVRDVPGLDPAAHADAGTAPVYLAGLTGGELTADTDYIAVRAGSHDGVPLYWAGEDVAAAVADAVGSLTLSWLERSDTLTATVTAGAGRCAGVAAQTVVLTYSAADEGWVGATPLATDTGDWTVYFYAPDADHPVPWAFLLSSDGSSYADLEWIGFADQEAHFAGAGDVLCGGTAATACAANSFRVAVRCGVGTVAMSCCPVPVERLLCATIAGEIEPTPAGCLDPPADASAYDATVTLAYRTSLPGTPLAAGWYARYQVVCAAATGGVWVHVIVRCLGAESASPGSWSMGLVETDDPDLDAVPTYLWRFLSSGAGSPGTPVYADPTDCDPLHLAFLTEFRASDETGTHTFNQGHCNVANTVGVSLCGSRFAVTVVPYTGSACEGGTMAFASLADSSRVLTSSPRAVAEAATVASPLRGDPCRHAGRELTGEERQAAGVGHAKRWALCLHPAHPLGPAVCGCKGCGPRCPGYMAGGEDGAA